MIKNTKDKSFTCFYGEEKIPGTHETYSYPYDMGTKKFQYTAAMDLIVRF